MASILHGPSTASGQDRLVAILLVPVVALLGVLGIDGKHPEVQMFVLLATGVLLLGWWWARRTTVRYPELSARFLLGALSLHLVGALARFAVMQIAYHGVSDSMAYFNAGTLLSPSFRALQFPPLPEIGTETMNWISGMILALVANSQMGAFVVCSVLSFVGAWYFYKAFRIGFPQGDRKLYAALIFLLPSIWYWPSSLGKDAIMMFFLGIATYGFILVLNGSMAVGVVHAAVGAAGLTLIRPPVGATLVIAAIIGFFTWPKRLRAPVQILVWLLVLPLLGGLLVYTVRRSTQYFVEVPLIEVYKQSQEREFTGGSGSNFAAPNLLSVPGPPLALITTTLRPFPFEAGGALPLAASMEGVFLVGLIIVRRRNVFQAIWGWRDNRTVVFVVSAWIGMCFLLSTLSNFGLLARQRVQALPFFLMIPAIIAVPRPSRQHRTRQPSLELPSDPALSADDEG